MFVFLRELESMAASYRLGYYTHSEFPPAYGAITVHVDASAAERWEIDFSPDGTVHLERFGLTRIEEETPELDALVAELRANHK